MRISYSWSYSSICFWWCYCCHMMLVDACERCTDLFRQWCVHIALSSIKYRRWMLAFCLLSICDRVTRRPSAPPTLASRTLSRAEVKKNLVVFIERPSRSSENPFDCPWSNCLVVSFFFVCIRFCCRCCCWRPYCGWKRIKYISYLDASSMDTILSAFSLLDCTIVLIHS